jgi:hypothetical protein
MLWVIKQVSVFVKIKLKSCKVYSLNTTELNQIKQNLILITERHGKFLIILKLSNTFSNNSHVKEEIESEIKSIV